MPNKVDRTVPLISESDTRVIEGVASRNGKNRTLRLVERSKRTELAALDPFALSPDVVACQVDMLQPSGDWLSKARSRSSRSRLKNTARGSAFFASPLFKPICARRRSSTFCSQSSVTRNFYGEDGQPLAVGKQQSEKRGHNIDRPRPVNILS